MTSREEESRERERYSRKKPDTDFPRAYIRLRTILDGFEMSALRFCLDNRNVGKRLQRIAEVEEMVMPLLSRMQDKLIAPGDGPGVCGEGLFNCGGVCVPYQCPDKYSNPRS